MKKLFLLFLVCIVQVKVQAQIPTQEPYPNAVTAATNINSYGFFINSVSILNEQTLSFAAGSTNTSAGTAISIAGVGSGVHNLFVKVNTIDGTPSITNIGTFFMEGDNLYPNVPAAVTPIDTYSFFVDSVSAVNEQPLSFIAANTNTTAANAISLTGVSSGVHQLYAKVTTTNGVPSITNIGTFFMEGDNLYPNVPAAATPIDTYSFFVDSVSAVNEQPLSFIAANTNTTAANAISLTGVSSGVHQLYAKVTTTNGVPSITNIGTFFIEGDNLYPNAPASATQINRYEFFIDSVTNTNIQSLVFTTASQNTSPGASIDLLGVLPGIHNLYARVYDVNNVPSITNIGQFAMDQNFRYADAAAPAPPLQNLEYYIDTDPGYGLATAINLPGTNTNEIFTNLSVSIPNNLSTGEHFFHIRSRQNPWSIDNAIPFQVGVVLPVTWLYVKAQVLNNNSLVQWSTANELNSKSYEVEWSTDGINFTKISSLNAAGNANSNSNYEYTHGNPATGLNYYRIKQIDIDGRFTYSAIVKLIYENANSLSKMSVYPNPATDFITIKIPDNQRIFLQIFDAQGKQEISQNVTNQATLKIDVTSLAKGNYVIRVSDGKDLYSRNFIKL